MATSKPLSPLADKIKANASVIEAYLQEQGEPAPSFDITGPERFPNAPELQMARMQLLEAAMDVFILASGPGEFMTWMAVTVSSPTAV